MDKIDTLTCLNLIFHADIDAVLKGYKDVDLIIKIHLLHASSCGICQGLEYIKPHHNAIKL